MGIIVGNSYYDTKYVTIAGLSAMTLAGMTAPIFSAVKENQVEQAKNAVYTVINKTTDLGRKGLTVENITSVSKKNGFIQNQIAKGKNAGFDLELNRVLVNLEKAPLAAFHEIGHAHNYQNIVLRKIQGSGIYFLAAGLLAAFIPKIIKETPQNSEKITTKDKIKNKLRSVSPAIAACCMLPTVFEEGLASIKASKFVKPLLDKNLYNKMALCNAAGFLSYLGLALSMAFLAKINRDS